MCNGSSRRIIWDKDSSEINLYPIFDQDISQSLVSRDEAFSIEFNLNHVTDIDNFQIFSGFKSKNISMIMDMIDSHVGVNAVNEWGETPLMMATTRQMFPVIAHLLNTRMPAVEVNMAKSVCIIIH
jgi:ankyrin repeat protein